MNSGLPGRGDSLLSEPLGNPPIPAKLTFIEIVQANVTLPKIKVIKEYPHTMK